MNKVIEKHYRENYDSLVKRFSRAADSVPDGEDIVQEGYRRALQYYDSYKTSKSLDAWVGTIMYNTLKDFKNDRGGLVSDVDPDTTETANASPEDSCDDLISGLMEGLRDSHKEVVELHYKCSYTPKEIVQVTEESLSNVKTILSRFRLLAINGGF